MSPHCPACNKEFSGVFSCCSLRSAAESKVKALELKLAEVQELSDLRLRDEQQAKWRLLEALRLGDVLVSEFKLFERQADIYMSENSSSAVITWEGFRAEGKGSEKAPKCDCRYSYHNEQCAYFWAVQDPSAKFGEKK